MNEFQDLIPFVQNEYPFQQLTQLLRLITAAVSSPQMLPPNYALIRIN